MLFIAVFIPIILGAHSIKLNISTDAWQKNISTQINQVITTYFARPTCIQIMFDGYMDFLIETVTQYQPVYQIRFQHTKCRNFILAHKNGKSLRSILQKCDLYNEAKYLLITSSHTDEKLLREIVYQQFYLDVLLLVVTPQKVSPPIQLGFVIGTSGRVDLQGRKMIIVGVRNPPFTVFEPWEKIKLNGVEVRVVKELAVTMNFTWKVREPKDGQAFGQRNETGHWTGLKGELASGTTDLGIALLYLNLEHQLSFQLSSPYTMVCVTFLVPAPQKILGHWLALLHPLTIGTWFTFLFISAVHTIILYFMSKKSMSTCVFETIRGAALVSGPQPRGPISQRVLLVTWLLGSFLVAGLYSSELSAFMVTQITRPPLKTLSDLARSDVTWGQMDTNMVSALQKSSNPTSRALMAKFQLENNHEEMERKVQGGKYALVVHVLSDGYPSGAEFLTPNARRNLVALPQCVSTEYISVGMRRGLPLTRAINLEVRRLQEAGLLQEWQARDVWTYGDRAEYKKSSRATTSSEPVQPLNLNNMAGAFGFWILGHLLAALVWVVETLAVRFRIIYEPPNKKRKTPVWLERQPIES